MSETLTGQDMKNLREMPDSLEMGELRKITTLQDISLAEGEGTFSANNEEHERKLKTNSLKRFFRLPIKKKSEDGSLEAEGSEIEIEEALGRKSLSTSFSKGSLRSSLSNYWSTVFKPKKSGKSTKSGQEMDSNLYEVYEPAASTNTVDYSTEAEDSQDNVCTEKDTNILEEIQSLNISEECPQK